MKNRIGVFVALMLCLSLAAGCTLRSGSAPAAASPPASMPASPAASDSAAPPPTDDPAGAAAEPEATPEPPSTVPDLPPAPEKNGMYELLSGVFDNYHPGTAGSSLSAARYAASMVDWAVKNGGDAVRSGCMAWDRGDTNEFGETLFDKLLAMYSTALTLTGPGKGVLEDSGYTEPWDYSARQVRGAFETMFNSLEMRPPILLLIWHSDDTAEHFRAYAAEVTEISPEVVTAALTDQVLRDGSAVVSVTEDGSAVRADMNEAFSRQVNAMGTSGEYMLIGSLVNTLLDAYGADTVLITVDGRPLETGHNIYDGPLGRYEDAAS